MGGKSLSTGTKSFPNKFVSTNFSEGFHLKKKKLNKKNKDSTKQKISLHHTEWKIRFEKYVSAKRKISFTSWSIWKMEKITSTSQKISF